MKVGVGGWASERRAMVIGPSRVINMKDPIFVLGVRFVHCLKKIVRMWTCNVSL